jgi:nucleoside-diphosphate-sugar epimerase
VRVLVTGAAGFLGTHVIRQLVDRGHFVRAVLRTAGRTRPQEWNDRVQVVYADLRVSSDLKTLFDGIDVLIHLAAAMHGTAEEQRAETLVSTERLLDAMRTARTASHIVLAGSCSVYDWVAVRVTLNEDSPLDAEINDRDGYATAKILQERLARKNAQENQWTLSVLRPGFIYGSGASPAAGAGLRLGCVFLVVAPRARLRLTHVENCARAFVEAAEKRIDGTFNIIDDEHVSAWRYAGRLNKRESGLLRVPVPYHAGLMMAKLATGASRTMPKPGSVKLPGILNPRQYCARFKPLQYDNHRAKEGLGWRSQPYFETGCDVT